MGPKLLSTGDQKGFTGKLLRQWEALSRGDGFAERETQGS